ncbi:MAG: dTDP-4-dehydrorhamnose reductase [Lachnoclostridium sp.]|nr:dTDP-4-dehydrorhamnose reductase [Lachnoclostridium sp.]
MNVLVTGANGQLGSELRLVSNGMSDNYIFTDVNELDITDEGAVRKTVADHNINIIVNCAAYTDVNKAESDYDKAMLLNARAAANLACAIRENDGVLIHISTDYVFGGENNIPIKEDEPTNPIGVYGMTKLEGEKEIARSRCKAIILRTSWLYSEYGKNFVKTMLDLTSNKKDLNVVFDQCGTPTYARDLADAIIDIIAKRKFEGNFGIYHFSNEGVCSWYDFAKAISQMAGYSDCNIQPCHSDEFPSPVKRPAYSVLDKTKYKSTFDRQIPYWTDSLKICINNLTHEA